MQGTAPANDSDIGKQGASLAPGEERTFVDPICNHASLFNQDGYVIRRLKLHTPKVYFLNYPCQLLGRRP